MGDERSRQHRNAIGGWNRDPSRCYACGVSYRLEVRLSDVQERRIRRLAAEMNLPLGAAVRELLSYADPDAKDHKDELEQRALPSVERRCRACGRWIANALGSSKTTS